MEQKPEFKRNLWGYEKEAVLKYIDEMSRSAKQTEEQLSQKLEQITRSREELEGKIADFEQKLQSVSDDLDSEKGKNKKLNEMITLLQQEIDRQRRRFESRERDYQSVQEQNRALQEQVRQTAGNSKKYEEAAAAIGSTMLEAQQSAQIIVENANRRAQDISRETDAFISGVLEKVEGMQSDFLVLREKMNQSIDLLNERFDRIEADILHAKKLVLHASQQTPGK